MTARSSDDAHVANSSAPSLPSEVPHMIKMGGVPLRLLDCIHQTHLSDVWEPKNELAAQPIFEKVR